MRLGCALLVVGLVASCGGGAGFPEVEPNGSMADAQAFGTLSYDRELGIHGFADATADRQDWFKFEPFDPEGTGLLVEVELSYLPRGSRILRLRAFFDGVEANDVDTPVLFHAEPEVVEGNLAVIAAVLDVAAPVEAAEVAVVVEATAGGASYDLALRTSRG